MILGSGGSVNGESGGGSVVGKVSNTFGSSLGRDIDGDGDNDNGVILNNIAGGSRYDYGYSIAIYSGNVYVTGQSWNASGNFDAYVIRLNEDGSIDSSFGNSLGRDINEDGVNDNGVIIDNIAGENVDEGSSIKIDGSGKIYVVGTSSGDVFVMRLNSDGSMDSSFGSGGKVILSNIIQGGGGYETGYAIAIDRNGKIYITGYGHRYFVNNFDVYVIRLNEDGSIDRSFGNEGKVILSNIAVWNITGENSDDYSMSILIDRNGKVYVTGWSFNYYDTAGYVIRLNEDGSIDSSFGNSLGRDINEDGVNDNGVVIDNIVGSSGGSGISIAIDGSGKVYVTGDSYNGSNSDAYVIRLNEDGSMDGSFGSGGKVILSSIAGGNGVDYGSSVAIDGNGKVYVTGFSSNGSNDDAFVIRLNSDGSVDSGFGSGGKVVLHNITGGNGRDICNSMVIDVNGKVYITGYSDNISSNADAYVIKIE